MAKYEAKTKPEVIDIEMFLSGVEPKRQADARRLVAVFRGVTGFEPVVWASMIGFGCYEYRYASGHSGPDGLARRWPVTPA